MVQKWVWDRDGDLLWWKCKCTSPWQCPVFLKPPHWGLWLLYCSVGKLISTETFWQLWKFERPKHVRWNVCHADKDTLFLLGSCENMGPVLTESFCLFSRESSPSGQCYNHHVKIDVFKSKMDSALLYGEIRNSDLNKKVTCPDLVNSTCEILKGKLTWEKVRGRNSSEEQWCYWSRQETRRRQAEQNKV